MAMELEIGAVVDENAAPVDVADKTVSPVASPKPLSKLQQRLRELAAKKPLKLTDDNVEIELSTAPEPEPAKEVDEATKWFMAKANVSVLPPTPAKSPKGAKHRNVKAEEVKQKLKERLKEQRREGLRARYQVYNADNELDVEEEEEDAFTDEEDGKELDNEPSAIKKKRIVVNEDEEVVEVESEESEAEVDDGSEYGDGNEDERERNPMIDEEASEDDDEMDDYTPFNSRVCLDDDEDTQQSAEQNSVVPTVPPPAKLFDSDDEECSRDTLIPEDHFVVPSTQSDNDSKADSERNLIDITSLSCPFNPSQIAEPQTEPTVVPDSQPYTSTSDVSVLPSQSESQLNEELLLLCSSGFGTQKSDATLCSRMDKYDINDYLVDSSQDPPAAVPGTEPAAPDPTSIKEFRSDAELLRTDSEIQDEIDRIQQKFYEAEDSIVPDVTLMFDDGEASMESTSRKRPRIVDSDEEDEPVVKRSQRLIDSDDSDVEMNETLNVVPVSDRTDLLAGMDDIFTVEDAEERPTDRIPSKILFDDPSDNEADEPVPDANERRKGFLDDEASLSGDDVDDDPEEESDHDNEYELEAGDDDEFDEDEVRAGLTKHYLKQQKDDDDRRLLRLQEKFFAEGDLRGVGDGLDLGFRKRMGQDISDEDWKKLIKKNLALQDFANDSDDDEDDEAQKRSLEMKKWRLSQSQTTDVEIAAEVDELDFDSPLMSVGRRSITRTAISTKSVMNANISNSLLRNTHSLSTLFKETPSEPRGPTTLFTTVSNERS